MKVIPIPPTSKRTALLETSTEELVELVLRQQEIIAQLVAEVDRLQANASSDSRSSSKPPSTDIHKRSEKQPPTSEESPPDKRQPGGQPGHPCKTRQQIDQKMVPVAW